MATPSKTVGIPFDAYNTAHALIAAIEDEDMDCNDLRSFAETFRVEEKEWATAYGCQDLSDMAHSQGSIMFEKWKEARDNMLNDLEVHVKAAEEILAKLGNVQSISSAAALKKLRVDAETKTGQTAKKSKSENLFEQIENLAETVRKLKGDGGF